MKYLFFTISLLYSIFSFTQQKEITQKNTPIKKIIINCRKCNSNGKPLIIVDNKRITENNFTKIDPNRIKSINVYKKKTLLNVMEKMLRMVLL